MSLVKKKIQEIKKKKLEKKKNKNKNSQINQLKFSISIKI